MNEKIPSKAKLKTTLGVVSSDRMNKSRVAVVERTVKHSQYGKYIKRKFKVMFHDEENKSKVGDKVLIAPSRPMSARKRYSLMSVVESGKE